MGDVPPPPEPLTPLWALKAVYFLGTGSGGCLFNMMQVYFHNIGLSNGQIGMIQAAKLGGDFFFNLVWAALCDYLGHFKGVLCTTHALATVLLCCLLLPAVQGSYAMVAATLVLGSGVLTSKTSVVDAMSLQVMEDYQRAAARQEPDPECDGGVTNAPRLPSYGEQRLWGAAGLGVVTLCTGFLLDAFGIPAMFAAFAVCISIVVVVIIMQMPPGHSEQSPGPAPDSESELSLPLLRFEVVWYFANLFVYGVCMAIVETLIYIYLLRDFEGTTKALLGATTAMTCLFEVPVFFYVDRLFAKWDLRWILTFCHVVLAFRCLVYSLLPRSQPYLVLLVEPLHGITFAAMWSCSVEFARRLAPGRGKAVVQALSAGLYYKLAMAVGASMWGMLTAEYGFRPMYQACAAVLVLWSVAWNVGWAVARRRGCATSAAAPEPPSDLKDCPDSDGEATTAASPFISSSFDAGGSSRGSSPEKLLGQTA